jgi:hypothetical protein
MYPALIAAAFDNVRDPRILLNLCGAAVALALLAECNQQSRREYRAPGNAANNL